MVTRDKKRFFELVDRLLRSCDPEEQKLLKEELVRMTFGKGEKLKAALHAWALAGHRERVLP